MNPSDPKKATPAQIEEARAEAYDFNNDDHESLEIDDGAAISEAGDGSGYWIQAWLWMPTPEPDSVEGHERGCRVFASTDALCTCEKEEA